ncbi:hypothetical protein [Deinococcus fonticola]|uniref:hypothetical protein n=1 Tax=Deinococcus fonticola TaxID=2528713 RepID=UPI001F0F0410|nr:hypothetical protein [Deinococcus fonticola]
MDASIRPASPDDAPGIAQVYTQSWRETSPGLMPGDFLSRMTSDAARQRSEESWLTQRLTPDPGRPVLAAELNARN